MSEPVVSCRDLRKIYQGPAPVEVLKGVNLTAYPGQVVSMPLAVIPSRHGRYHVTLVVPRNEVA